MDDLPYYLVSSFTVPTHVQLFDLIFVLLSVNTYLHKISRDLESRNVHRTSVREHPSASHGIGDYLICMHEKSCIEILVEPEVPKGFSFDKVSMMYTH